MTLTARLSIAIKYLAVLNFNVRSSLRLVLARSPVELIYKARFLDLFQDGRVHQRRGLESLGVWMAQRVHRALNAIGFRHREFAHALGDSVVEIFLHGGFFDAGFFHHGVDEFGANLKKLDPFDVAHEHAAHRFALVLYHCRGNHDAEAGVVER